jgi:hypothetical protein
MATYISETRRWTFLTQSRDRKKLTSWYMQEFKEWDTGGESCKHAAFLENQEMEQMDYDGHGTHVANCCQPVLLALPSKRVLWVSASSSVTEQQHLDTIAGALPVQAASCYWRQVC